MKEGGLYSSIYLISVRDENYVGGVGFRNQGNLIKPYDNMEF